MTQEISLPIVRSVETVVCAGFKSSTEILSFWTPSQKPLNGAMPWHSTELTPIEFGMHTSHLLHLLVQLASSVWCNTGSLLLFYCASGN